MARERALEVGLEAEIGLAAACHERVMGAVELVERLAAGAAVAWGMVDEEVARCSSYTAEKPRAGIGRWHGDAPTDYREPAVALP